MTIFATIDVTKIAKEHLVKGKKGIYLDIALFQAKENQYGDDYIVVQSIGKEARIAGQRGAILGNARISQPKDQPTPQPPQTAPAQPPSDESVPF